MAHDVFISYAAADKPIAEAVCTRLESVHRIRCWIAPRDVPENSAPDDARIAALDRAKIMVPIFGGSQFEAQFKREVERAVLAGIKVIPFHVEPANATETLERITRVADSVAALLDRVPASTGQVRAAATSPERTAWPLWIAVAAAGAMVVALVVVVVLRTEGRLAPSETPAAPSTAASSTTAATPAGSSPPLSAPAPPSAEAANTSPAAAVEGQIPAPPVSASLGTQTHDAPAPAPDAAASDAVSPAPPPAATPAGADAAGASAPAAGVAAAGTSTAVSPQEPASTAAAHTPTGTLQIDLVNTLSDGEVELKVDGHVRWTEQLKLDRSGGLLARLKLQRVSEQIDSSLDVPAGDHQITVTVLTAAGEVWDFGTTPLRVDVGRSVTLRIRFSRFGNHLQLETEAS